MKDRDVNRQRKEEVREKEKIQCELGAQWSVCCGYIWLDDVFIAFDGLNKASVVERRQAW